MLQEPYPGTTQQWERPMLESAPANNQPGSLSRRIPVVHRKEVRAAGCLFTRHIHFLDTPLLDVVGPHFQAIEAAG